MTNPLENFIGNWNINAWGLMSDGKELTAIGIGEGKDVLTASNTAKIDYFDIEAEGYERTLNGYAIINFDKKDGLTLSTYGSDNKVDARFVGEHIAEQKNSHSEYI